MVDANNEAQFFFFGARVFAYAPEKKKSTFRHLTYAVRFTKIDSIDAHFFVHPNDGCHLHEIEQMHTRENNSTKKNAERMRKKIVPNFH